MENFKFILVSIIVLAVVVFVGYWAVSTIEPGNVYVYRQNQKQLEEKNKELEMEVSKLKSELGLLQASKETQAQIIAEQPEATQTENTSSSEYQDLINDIQKLVDDNVFMKEKSQGGRVGTIQIFLNIYNGTSKEIDNDYGGGTKADVIKFQKAEGLSADGETGPNTYRKMIEWLKKQ